MYSFATEIHINIIYDITNTLYKLTADSLSLETVLLLSPGEVLDWTI